MCRLVRRGRDHGCGRRIRTWLIAALAANIKAIAKRIGVVANAEMSALLCCSTKAKQQCREFLVPRALRPEAPKCPKKIFLGVLDSSCVRSFMINV